MKFPVKYQNGDWLVSLESNGTKVRELISSDCDFSSNSRVNRPESIDLKVTDWCDARCAFCHESSTVYGKHADLEPLLVTLADLGHGTEIAIGGGNPLTWPFLEEFLTTVKNNFVCNITINGLHVGDTEVGRRNKERLRDYQERELIHGIGISAVTSGLFRDAFRVSRNDGLKNVIGHVIAGRLSGSELFEFSKFLNNPDCSDFLFFDECNPEDLYLDQYLILGYKYHGRGNTAKIATEVTPRYSNRSVVQKNLYETRLLLPRVLFACSRSGINLAFDNLAIEQLNVKKILTDTAWSEYYMGREGSISMYIDGVKGEYAVSSTSPANERVSWDMESALTFFETKRVAIR